MLNKNIFDEYKYRLELHAHTNPASGCSEVTPEELANIYKDWGCHAVAVTNHFFKCCMGGISDEELCERYLDDYHRAKKEGDRIGINVILGMELRFTENFRDYLIYGISEDDVYEICKYTVGTLADFRNSFKSPKMIIIQAHPFRDGLTAADPALLDGIEAFNMHPESRSRVPLAAEFVRKHPSLIATCGSDFHNKGYQGTGLMCTKTLPANSYELADLIRTNDFLFDFSGFIVTRT